MANTRAHKLSLIGAIILAAIFLYSGWIKLQDLDGFQKSVASFRLVPESLIPYVVHTIPPLEILAGILLFWRRSIQGAATCITLLCVGFVFFYAYAWSQGIEPSCGCFGSNPLLQANPPQGIIRAAIIGALAWGVLKGAEIAEQGKISKK